jgi:hypothetical protein
MADEAVGDMGAGDDPGGAAQAASQSRQAAPPAIKEMRMRASVEPAPGPHVAERCWK